MTQSLTPFSLTDTRAQAHGRTRLHVLVACEESQAVCRAFRDLGHVAYSCDIQPVCKAGNPYWHIQGDVTPLLQGDTAFNVQAGFLRTVPQWDLIIAHPPCTYLCKVGSPWLYVNPDRAIFRGNREYFINGDRYDLLLAARTFFFQCLDAVAPYVAVENPLPMALAGLPHPTTYICPSWFGAKYTKKTLLWLKNLPPLMPTVVYSHPKELMRSSRGKYRARTFPQVARAMAEQWSAFILDDLDKHPR